MSNRNDSLVNRLIDDYQIEAPLGSGGMARVYRALDIRLRRYVALKVIASGFSLAADYRSRFEREAQAVARLEHPNIVRIYRFGETHDGLYYMAMEYVDGVDLDKLISHYRANGEVMPLSDVVNCIRQIGDALDYAHSQNIIHRDIKPANIIINNLGRAVLTDFGLALVGDLGTQGEIFGSPHYLSPEQAISSASAVPQSDLYGLGATLFEMLTGEVPFAGDDPMDVAMRHISELPSRPSDLLKSISPALDEVVLHSLEKEPQNRFQTGAALSSALLQAVEASRLPQSLPPSASEVRQPSLMVLADKVQVLMTANPLPEMPPTAVPPSNLLPPEMPPNSMYNYGPSKMPEESSGIRALAQTQASTRPAAPAAPTRVASPPPTQPAYSVVPRTLAQNKWLILLSGAAILAVVLFGLVLLALVPHESKTDTPTLAAILPSTTLEPASPTPLPTRTWTAIPPTPTALILSSSLVPNPTMVVVLPTQVLVVPTVAVSQPYLPPTDRTILPPNSRRMGDFTVESLCDRQGLKPVEIDNQTHWACADKSSDSVVFVMEPVHFDQLCQEQYGMSNAVAFYDKNGPVVNYNWSCYAVDITAGITSTPEIAVVLPTFNSLHFSYDKDWIAFTNVSTQPLSLADFVLDRDGRTVSGYDWGQLILYPNECLRIYKKKVPNVLPDNCNTVHDLAGEEKERKFWLEGVVTVTVHPGLKYKLSKD